MSGDQLPIKAETGSTAVARPSGPSPIAVPVQLQPSELVLKRSLRRALLTILLCFGFVGGWLVYARLDSAVVAHGVLENTHTTRLIQHLEGGLVREIFVANGDKVKAGDLLLRLDPTQTEATAALFDTQILGNRARQERLEAEIVMAETLEFSADLQEALATKDSLARVVELEQRRFGLLRGELEQSRDLLQTNIAQLEEEIRGNEVRRSIGERESTLVQSDLADQKSLLERGLTNQARVTQLEQQKLQLEERMAQADIEIARIRQAILGLRLQITQIEQEYRARAAAEQELVTREIRSLERDAVIATDSLSRVDIFSPVDGTVQESTLGTIGAVIRGGDTIMRIAPADDSYVIVARVAPNDIDGLVPGAASMITFPAFTFMDLPPATGEVLSISRDRLTDPVTRTDYYEARLRLDDESLPPEPRARLVAGMTATAIMPTGERTALNYLVGPLLRRFQIGMREQ